MIEICPPIRSINISDNKIISSSLNETLLGNLDKNQVDEILDWLTPATVQFAERLEAQSRFLEFTAKDQLDRLKELIGESA